MNTAPSHLGDAPVLLPRSAGNVHRQHAIQLYTDEPSLLDLLERYAGKALTSGNAVIVLATQFHLKTLHRRLTAQGVNPEKIKSSGCYVPLDAEQTLHKLMVNDVIDEHRFRFVIGEALRKGRASIDKVSDVMVFGELVALLWTAGKRDEAARVERLWNEMATNQSFSLLCAYPVQGFTSASDIELFARVCGEHSVVIPTDDFLMLGSESARLRNVAQLQQRAIALEGGNIDQTRLLESRFPAFILPTKYGKENPEWRCKRRPTKDGLRTKAGGFAKMVPGSGHT
jgi:hypothetical protein